MSRKRSIRQRVMRVVMTTTLLALLLSATTLLIYELQTRRTALLEDLQTQADLIAQASLPALSFDDARAAGQTLALLRLRPQIEGAALYRRDGRLFASYAAPGQPNTLPALVERDDGPVFEGRHVLVQQQLVAGDEPLGTLVLQARSDLLPLVFGYIAMLGLVMLASLAVAGLVAARLQRSITEPIVAVADVAREVEQQRNYALRATKTSDDEVGALVDAFNNMLGELGNQTRALQLADQRKDEFLATLAHELRNPLAPLSTGLTLLGRETLDAAERERIRLMMERQLAQLIRLIDDLMEVARISTGQLQLRPEKFDLVDAVRAAWESVAAAAQERGHRMVVEWPAAACWLEGDRARLAQVFTNLLTNAVRYTEPGGRIELAFERQDATIEVCITDNGIGIEPSMHSAVFDMFVQVDQSLGRGRAGLGVGLSLARQLVALHHGTIELKSRGLGHGAAFTVRLPCLPCLDADVAPADPVAATAPAEPPASAGLRLLVADDNRDSADSLAEVLRALGYDVKLAYDGQAALEALRQWRPDVGLFDIGMPGMNGYELATAVRSQPGGDKTLLIAITGWGQDTDRERARAAGFDHHFVKPVDLDALTDMLDARAALDGAERQAGR